MFGSLSPWFGMILVVWGRYVPIQLLLGSSGKRRLQQRAPVDTKRMAIIPEPAKVEVFYPSGRNLCHLPKVACFLKVAYNYRLKGKQKCGLPEIGHDILSKTQWLGAMQLLQELGDTLKTRTSVLTWILLWGWCFNIQTASLYHPHGDFDRPHVYKQLGILMNSYWTSRARFTIPVGDEPASLSDVVADHPSGLVTVCFISLETFQPRLN